MVININDWSVDPASGSLGVRIPVATEQIQSVLKTGSDSSTSLNSVIGVSVTGVVDDHYKWRPRITVGVKR